MSRPSPGAIEPVDQADDDDPGDYCDRYAAALEAAVASGASWDEAVHAARQCRHQPPAEQLAAIRNCAARRH